MQDQSVTFKPATFRQDVPSCYRFLYQYPQKQHHSFASRLIRIILATISHFQKFPVDILFCAGVRLGCLRTAVVVFTLAPVLLTPTITFIPPALGFAGYNVTNSLIGGVPGLLISYQLNRCIAAPARNAREHREEGWTSVHDKKSELAT